MDTVQTGAGAECSFADITETVGQIHYSEFIASHKEIIGYRGDRQTAYLLRYIEDTSASCRTCYCEHSVIDGERKLVALLIVSRCLLTGQEWRQYRC